jgi:hypothetical protein
VSSTPVSQTLQVANFDITSTEPVRLDVGLQGIILGMPHDITIALNGSNLGDLTFTGQGKGQLEVSVPAGILQNGINTVTLTAQNGDYDYSLVQSG